MILEDKMQPEITYTPSLKQRTTLRLGGTAIAEVLLSTDSHFAQLSDLLKKLGGRPFVLGRGSNILANDGELPLVLLRLQCTDKPTLLDADESCALISVSGDVPLPVLLSYAAEQGLGGLEGLAGIPGTLGGAVAMNAGSFGSEIGNFLTEVEFYAPETGLFRKSKHEINPMYRNFSFSGQESAAWHIICRATLKLPRKDPEAVRAQMQANFQKKQATQPLSAASAGCAFKNPSPEFPAGLLLERCGFKGKKLGGMMFSPLHANFLVNQGNGTSAQAMELLNAAKNTVKKNFGIDLELEVKTIP